ncbi:hypothetical protein HII17_00255 [Thalassotalea sp. M1531]|uniref:EF-hand domain-containing protein n=1 Tax=Thalassotalea algicola TaxID=2716224 RepID=A0A7Y0Q5D3_9GAMM|nr:hypothetical protein [Thalassotalea algicola]NMP29976.1 hypothetical protein [Thalassotalea algicola]
MKIKQKFATGLLFGAIVTSLAVTSANVIAKERGRGNADTNGDMAIDISEAIAAATTKTEKRFETLDADLDGAVSLDEYLANDRSGRDLTDYAQDIVDCVADIKDESGSETIVVPEVESFQTPEQRFSNVDANADGVIELSEAIDHATTKATEKFNTMDTDLDGLVTKEERQAHRENFRGTHKAIKECIDLVTSEDSDF